MMICKELRGAEDGDSVFFLLLLLITLNACSQNKGNKSESKQTVFSKKDDLGRIVEQWGNEKTFDNNINFRYFFNYDSHGRLVEEKQYYFDDNNKGCNIIDSIDFIRVEYIYDDKNTRVLEKKYFPIYDNNDKVTEHRLGYIYHFHSGFEEVIK